MRIKRDFYLDRLIEAKGDGFVKILTGIRRCGKSYLLFHLFRRHLLESGVPPKNIVALALDQDENIALRDPIRLGENLRGRLGAISGKAYVLLDEIQMVHRVRNPDVDPESLAPGEEDAAFITFYDVLNSLAAKPGVDVYVTGSNSRMLASDIATNFRGRGDPVRVHPLSFAEYLSAAKREKAEAWESYLTYGGMPFAATLDTDKARRSYLAGLFAEVYYKDIRERLGIREDYELDSLVQILCSSVGSLTNPHKLVSSLLSVQGVKTNDHAVKRLLDGLEDAFLFRKAQRWDVKGRRYLEYPSKYYIEDVGLRNAKLNFRQREPTHLMENIVHNELVRRGLAVDVGVVEVVERKNGRRTKTLREIDFVVNDGPRRIYVQSAYAIPDEEKRRSETLSLRKTGDFFRKIVVTGDLFEKPWADESGIEYVGILPFLLGETILGG